MAEVSVPSWRHQARCRAGNPEGLDPELWFPVGHTGPAIAQAAYAKDLCSGCPVRPECLDAALDGGYSGVWGGTTEEERRRLRAGVPSVEEVSR